MASIWERLGERVGYAIGAVIFGPSVMIERRARRLMRDALLGWCEGLVTTKLVAPRGTLRRTVSLAASGESLLAEVDVDLRVRRATVLVAVQALPTYVRATIARAPWLVHMTRVRLGKPLAVEGTLRIDAETLDVETGRELLAAVAAGPLNRLEALDLEVRTEQLELRVVAPSAAEEWSTIGAGLAGVAAWLTKRWPASYRS